MTVCHVAAVVLTPINVTRRLCRDSRAGGVGAENKDVKKLTWLAVAGLLAVVMASSGLAAGGALNTTPDVQAGHALAQRWCAVCHKVEAGDQQMTDVPPTFESVAQMPSATETSLKVWLQTSHPNMPNLRLSQDEMNDVAAYILSLKRS